MPNGVVAESKKRDWRMTNQPKIKINRVKKAERKGPSLKNSKKRKMDNKYPKTNAGVRSEGLGISCGITNTSTLILDNKNHLPPGREGCKAKHGIMIAKIFIIIIKE